MRSKDSFENALANARGVVFSLRDGLQEVFRDKPIGVYAKRFGKKRMILWGGVSVENKKAIIFTLKMGLRSWEFLKEMMVEYQWI